MVYLDANVFVFAALEAGELGNAARHILANLPKVKAKTCCLTLDELLGRYAPKQYSDSRRSL